MAYWNSGSGGRGRPLPASENDPTQESAAIPGSAARVAPRVTRSAGHAVLRLVCWPMFTKATQGDAKTTA